MAGMRLFLAVLTLLAAMFFLLESVMGALLAHTAYERGQLRGVPFHVWARTDAIFIVATVILSWATYKLISKKNG
jgi:hypothetical protein